MTIGKKYAIWAAAIIAVLLVGWLVWKQTAKKESSEPANSTSTTLEEDKGADQAQTLQGNVLAGKLQVSNNSQKGNLMLVTPTSTLYIHTSRDYSSLLGKDVKVNYDGTPEEFRLGDIVESK
jgi:hypothetical protein